MSLFSRRWLLIGFLLLTACGFEPIYGTNKPANLILGKIDVEVSNGRNAFELRERLLERLGALDGTPTYLLKYTSNICLLYTSPSPRDRSLSRMPSSA